MKNGNGQWVGFRKDQYIGEWVNGYPDGYGIHIWINGDKYEGQF